MSDIVSRSPGQILMQSQKKKHHQETFKNKPICCFYGAIYKLKGYLTSRGGGERVNQLYIR